jgi:hypothetical protein
VFVGDGATAPGAVATDAAGFLDNGSPLGMSMTNMATAARQPSTNLRMLSIFQTPFVRGAVIVDFRLIFGCQDATQKKAAGNNYRRH